jgi:hypothetical protein
MNKCFQVRANTTEIDIVEVRERDGRDDWRLCELPFYNAVGNREVKVNFERLQVSHEGNPSDQSIWMEVRGWVDHGKMECDEAHSSSE